MRPLASQMLQYAHVSAACLLQRIRQNREPRCVEVAARQFARFIDSLGESRNGCFVPCQPCRVDCDWAKRVPENVTQQPLLYDSFSVSCFFTAWQVDARG